MTAVATAGAQPRVARIGPGMMTWNAEPRAVIGITTSGSSSSRDTLGVLVSSVRAGSPADKAGIEEGNRIAAINGVSLKLAAGDVGDYEMASVMTRRLTRELDKLKPGDDVELRVYANGQAKTVRVKTVSNEDLYESMMRQRDSERATLGLSVAATGTKRDTLGVFVMGADDSGPAAKAGIEEGSRIASVNGVDLRARRDDDEFVTRSSNVGRFEREMSRVKPGDDVELRVYYNGQYRNLKVKAARLSDLPRHNRSITIIGDGPSVFPRIPEMPSHIDVDIDGARIGDQVRRALESARVVTGDAVEGFGRAMARVGNRVSW
jgi:S1-C subfamily serine protease